MSAKTDDQHEAIEFFTRNYHALRERGPMAWMKRLFNDVRVGKQPRLIDLPTGAGKTELIVVWLIALAYHGARGRKGTPVPRRLVWVINRRVLVQQVFALAKLIEEKIADVPEVREGLAAMSGDPKTIFRLVQLRGQILADTEWATLPTVPQLVIGTVDQIGSRLFFEGYGLGKWNRPQQAALLGVDAWVAVDEAHLVPAFVLSLRQMRSLHMEMPPKILPKLRSIFDKLPFWLTELSATPGLPPPSGQPFRLEKDEENDPRIADRVLAANTRRVRLAWLGKGAKAADALADALASEALRQANANPSWAIAIFVRKVKDAKKVVARLEKKFKGQDRVCEITGRLRGYERERLVRSPVFRRFLSHVGQKLPEIDGPVFLVGTAAAEVGLDADAQSILCDFASLPTLLQRLGRLDRLGQQSSQCKTDGSEPPTMTIFASRPKTSDKARQAAKLIEAMVEQLARQLTKHEGEFSAELITGSLWRNATPETDKKVEGDENADATAENHSQEDGAAEETIAINDENSDSADNDRASADESEIETEDAEGNGKGKKAIAKLIDGATWKVLGVSGEAKSGTLTAPPARWLQESVASVAASPVVVPALTRATIEHWAATTEARTKYLSPHPFLYGHALDAESTPLVAVAFRLEIEALRQRHTDVDEEDTEDDDNERQLINIFKLFPPLRAELHHLPIIVLREWLKSADARPIPVLFRHRDRWHVKQPGESSAAVVNGLNPSSVVLLPATEEIKGNFKKVLDEAGKEKTTHCDVFNGVSMSARYRRRVLQASQGSVILKSVEDGAFRWVVDKDESNPKKRPTVSDKASGKWVPRLRVELAISDGTFRFDYLKLRKESGWLQYLRNHGEHRGHVDRAEEDAIALARTIAPENLFLETLLRCGSQHHDEGKRELLWQRAMGNLEGGDPMLAKLHPIFKKPRPMDGYRHEWQSLRQFVKPGSATPADFTPAEAALWHELLFHLIGAHHGRLRPSLPDNGLNPRYAIGIQNPLRISAAESYVRLQQNIGFWRLAYLEALLKTADVSASQILSEEESDEA